MRCTSRAAGAGLSERQRSPECTAVPVREGDVRKASIPRAGREVFHESHLARVPTPLNSTIA
jgi:hypothetical protein